jgi:hypothetical protein
MSLRKRFGLVLAFAILLSIPLSSVGGDSKNWRRALAVSRDCIGDREWGQAVEILQKCLNAGDDQVADILIKPMQIVSVKVHAEAERMLIALPKQGREAYEAHAGPEATKLLKAAESDEAKLKDLSRRFLFTKAGREGTVKLATLQFALGNLIEAAKTCARLAEIMPEVKQ